MRDKLRLAIVVSVVCLLVAACTGNDSGSGSTSGQGQQAGGTPAANPASYPRNETLYTSGTQWGPPNSWNPIMRLAVRHRHRGAGVRDRCSSTTRSSGELQPWLAEKGEWTGENEYTLTLRDGLTWSDGKPLTSDDVVFTVELGKIEAVPYSNLWNWLERASRRSTSARSSSRSPSPRTSSGSNYLYNRAIVPKHIWEGRSEEDIATGANEKPDRQRARTST